MDRTNAERQRRYIAKLKVQAKAGQAGVSNATDAAELEGLKAEIIRLKAELAGVRESRRPDQPFEASAIDPASLPKTSREKFEAMVRRQNREFEARVKHAADVEARQQLDEFYLPYWHERLDKVVDMLDLLGRGRPIISKKIFRIVLAAVQPTTRTSMTDEMLNDAAVAFNTKRVAIEIALCGKEAERPELPSHTDVPRSWTEMMARREKVRAKNSARAKRAATTRAARKESVSPPEDPDAEFVRQMEIAERLSDEHEAVFRELSKR